MLLTLIVGLLGTAVVLALAAKRVRWLFELISSGQKAGGRVEPVGPRLATQLTEVAGQKKLLKWTVPGIAHFFTMWAFLIMSSVYFEAYGALFNEHFQIPLLGRLHVLPALGFLQDFIAVACALSLGVFAIIRVRNAPEHKKRGSRFYGSHLGGAWLILIMIFNVVWTMFLFRGAASAAGHSPYGKEAFLSYGIGRLLSPLGQDTNNVLDRVGLLLHIGVMLVFLIIVLHSKHLHIFLAPINVGAKRLPNALGPLLPVESNGKPIDFEDPGEDDILGRGKIEDFTWKGMLDFATCTECGRCQSQCPAWNTGKPLSPKLVIMNLRDHMFAKAPYMIEGKPRPEEGSVEIKVDAHDDDPHHVPESGFERIMGHGPEQAVRPLVGTLEQGGVIDPDVLWSCTSCGACVEQCPVDIEHIDHIIDMRRYQVMMESEFPGELGTVFRNLENKGNPWGQNNSGRLDWAKDLGFDVPVYDGVLGEDVEYLYWIGCAGAFDDKAKKTVQATAELLYRADVNYVVLGLEETCTGDSARRAGNEFLFQQLAAQTIETLNGVFEGREQVRRKIVTTCPHCMNTLGREYPQLDGHYDVVHHTQLLNKLVRDRKLVPVKPADPTATVTYHDPCYLGRHNKVYTPPRELIDATGMTQAEMPRHGDRSFCCGAGGARMWMEEHIGKRINLDRVDEAIDTGAGTVVTGCPFCKVMVDDGLTQRADEGTGVGVGVTDVSQLLLESVKRGAPELPVFAPRKTPEKPKAAPAPAAAKTAVAEPAAAEPVAAAQATAAPAKAAPAKGLQMKGIAKKPGAKAPGAKAAAAPAPAATEAATPEVKPKGLGLAVGAKAPGGGLKMKAAAKAPGAKAPAAPAPAEASVEAPAAAPAESAAPVETAAPAEASLPTVKPKGLAVKSGFKKPGARTSAPATPASAEEAPADEAAVKEPAVEEASVAEAPVAEAAPVPETESAAPAAAVAPPAAKPGGLAFKSGAKAPGKKQ